MRGENDQELIPRMEAGIERLRSEYQQRVEKYKFFGCDIDAERRYVLEKVLPVSGRILEIGTGKGHLTLALAQEGLCFVSVDISAEEQAIARKLLQSEGLKEAVDFRLADAAKLDFAEGEFDLAISMNAVHHFVDPYAVVDEIIRVVSPKGKIAIGDFSPEGFTLVNKIHQQEGRTHNPGRIKLEDIARYLSGKKYSLRKFHTKYQQLIIAASKI